MTQVSHLEINEQRKQPYFWMSGWKIEPQFNFSAALSFTISPWSLQPKPPGHSGL